MDQMRLGTQGDNLPSIFGQKAHFPNLDYVLIASHFSAGDSFSRFLNPSAMEYSKYSDSIVYAKEVLGYSEMDTKPEPSFHPFWDRTRIWIEMTKAALPKEQRRLAPAYFQQ
jgi:hypothetical protein